MKFLRPTLSSSLLLWLAAWLPTAATAQILDVDRTYSDAVGDAVDLAGVALDLAEVSVSIDSQRVRFSGELAAPTGNFDTAWQSGSVAMPGNQARYLGMFYALFIDADRDPQSGFFGSEYILEVTFNVIPQDPNDPPGDFSSGIALGDPMIGLLRSFSATGAQTVTDLSTGFARTGDSFSVSVPTSALDLDPEISVQVAAITFGTDGTCVNSVSEPDFCSYFSDFAPESPAVLTVRTPPTPATIQFTKKRCNVREQDEEVAVGLVYSPGTSTGPASVDVIVTDGTADSSDFGGPTPRTVSFGGSQTTAEVVFDIVDDRMPERFETIEVGLANASGANLGTESRATIVIRDNDVRKTKESGVGGSTARSPLVLYDSEGRRAVLWDQVVGGVRQICAQIFAADGSPLTPVFLVDPDASSEQVNPSAAFTGRGLALAYERFARGGAAKGATGDTVGAFIGDVFGSREPEALPIADSAASSSPKVAADRNGNFVVTWNEGAELFGQEFDETARGSSRFSIGRAESDSVPETASSANGDYAVAWREGNPNGTTRIRMRRYRRGGRAKSSAVTVDQGPGLDAPSLAMAADGSLVVAYERPGGGGTDIYGVRYDRAGQATTQPVRLNS